LLADADGKCSYANEKWSAISGLTLEHTLDDGWARAVHPEDIENIAHAWIANRGDHEVRFRIRRPDASVRTAIFRRVRIPTDNGAAPGHLVTIAEVSGLDPECLPA
jgi:PAS domain S-box-containing protein